jgi:type II secretory pathway component PulC
VILRVNGVTLETPDKAQEALSSLKVASELVVEVIREGKPLRVRLAID